MKNIKFLPLFVLVICLSFQSCLKDKCEQITTWSQMNPIYKTQANLDAIQVSFEDARALRKPGALYFYNDYIFINEVLQGIHVIDNSDPKNPIKLSFINIDGNGDIAIKDGKLYADSYTTLFTLDISDINNIELVSRQSAAFEPIWTNQNTGEMYVGATVETFTRELDCSTRNTLVNRGGTLWLANDFDASFAIAEGSGGGGTAGGGAGTGGSMARFTLVGDHLYTVGQSDMTVFSLSNPDLPAQTSVIDLGWGIETIIPHEDKLFIGSNTGMQIWDNSTPEQPTFLSEFTHARACDPVFVKDNYAYVTLRDGSFCEGFDNQLDLIDISNIRNPVLEKTFNMDNPHGLSIDGDNLFLCEGDFGLKVFDIEDPKKLGNKKIEHIKNIAAYDVIAMPGESDILLMIGNDGFYQYDYSNPRKLEELSRIPVE